MRPATPLSSRLRRITLPALLGFALGISGCAPQGGEPSGGGTGGAPALASPLQSPYAGTPLVYLDDYPVTAAEIEDFAAANLKEGAHHGRGGKKETDVFQLLPGLIRQYTGVRYAVDHGIDRDPGGVQTLRLFRTGQMSGPMNERILQTALPTADEIRAALPLRWLRMDFELKVFDDLQQAQDAYRRISGGTPFEKITGSRAIAFKSNNPTQSKTGLIFPDSGFFDPADDGYLFTLKAGEVSHPVVTGLGPAIARVAEREDFTEEKKAAHLAMITKQATDRVVQARTAEAIGRTNSSVLGDVLADAVYLEMEGQQWSDEVVARVGNLDITYRQFRALKPVSTRWFIRSYPRDRWPTMMWGYLKQLLDVLALGMEAERQGIAETDAVRKAVHLFQWKMLNDLAQKHMADNLEVQVSEEEALSDFHRNMANFAVPDQISMRYYFTPDKARVDALWKNFEAGKPFEELATADLAASARPHGKSETPIRSRTIPRPQGTGSNPLTDALFTLKEGDTRLLEGPMGYYLVRVDAFAKARQRTFAEVKEQIRESIAVKKKQAGLSNRIKGLEKEVSVRFSGQPEGEGPKGTPAPGTLDRG